uniref:Uncharacterized protein n=1 Tax=Rhodosorus marinus TaxID=101924 RepID=A0A7S0BSD5_9RHOD
MEYQVVPGAVMEEAAVPSMATGNPGFAAAAPYKYVQQEFGVYGDMGIQKMPMQKMPVAAVPVQGMVPAGMYPADNCVPVFAPAPVQVHIPHQPLQPVENKEIENAKLRLRPRFETPRRRGNWIERWNGAREMGADSVPVEDAARVGAGVREFVAKVINMNVGLPQQTVEKWFQLLAEYLELSADEHVIMVNLFRKYLRANGALVSHDDWARPQKWECVLSISCYFSVLLSEEFAGQTSRELKDLLGPSFNFGKEQTDFLEAVGWKINVAQSEFTAARDAFLNYDGSLAGENALHQWFAPKLKTMSKKASMMSGKKRVRSANEEMVEVKRRSPSVDQAVPSFK